MKHFIASIILLAIFFAGYSQHTLSYNQSLLVSSSQTVPGNATWKVVSVLPSSNPISNQSNGGPAVSSFTININSNPVSFSSVEASFSQGNGSGTSFAYTSFNGDGKLPIWLPAGTTLAAGTNIQYISVIEFIIN